MVKKIRMLLEALKNYLKNFIRTPFDRFLFGTMVFFTGYSLVIIAWSFAIHVNSFENGEGYCQKPAWLLYFLWYPIVFWINVWMSNRFRDAWISFFDKKHGIVWREKRRGTDRETADIFLKSIEMKRVKLHALVFVISVLIVTVFIYRPTYRFPDVVSQIGIEKDLLPDELIQKNMSANNPDLKPDSLFWVNPDDLFGLYKTQPNFFEKIKSLAVQIKGIKDPVIYGLDFEIIGLFHLAPKSPASIPLGSKVFNPCAAFLEVIIGFFGIGLLINLCLNILYFLLFEKTGVAQEKKLVLRLDYRSPFKEFGLENWNSVFNDLYLITAAGMIIPLLSRNGFIKGSSGAQGQAIMESLICVFVFFPFLSEILIRRFKVRDAYLDVLKNNLRDADNFMSQSLWPFDHDYAGKVGFLIVLLEVSYMFTGAWNNLFGVF